MKKIFKVFGLQEIELVTSVSLHGSLSTDTESGTVRVHQGDFENELDAIKFSEDQFVGNKSGFEHGFEIIAVFVGK